MPRPFEFELESVLEQRRRVERSHQLAVATLEGQRLAIERTVEETQRRIGAGREELRSALAPSERAGRVLAFTGIRLSAASSLHGLVLLQRAAIELSGVHQRLKVARARLLTATTARKAVETLRERRYAAYMFEQKKREEAELDDLAVMRFGRDDS